MSVLYIANFQPCNFDLYVLGHATLSTFIPISGQLEIVNVSDASLARTVVFYANFGLIPVGSIPPGRPFNGLAYQYATPIPMASIPTSLDRQMFPIKPVQTFNPPLFNNHVEY